VTKSRNIKKRDAALICASLFLFIILASSLACFAADSVAVRDVRFWKSQDYIRFVFDLSGPVELSNGKLSNPERLFFDLTNAKLADRLKKTIEVNSEFVKSVRLGQFSSDTARIVFDIPAQTYDFKILNLEDPARLVIDIFAGGSKDRSKDDVKTGPRPDAPAEEKKPVQKFLRRIVVVDAGHGGHDPGAVGPTGLYEKNVVLDIALRVRQIIQKTYPLYKVVLTRDTDVFIPLPERTEIANRHNADLFISVHANASTNRRARGIETYFLNSTNSMEALKTAARENAVSLKKMKQSQSELGVILTSLSSEHKRIESVKVAGTIQRSMTGGVTTRFPETGDHGVKWAPFYVLVGANMPASLVEVSFISNHDEEKQLKTESYRQLIAQSIADGIHKYFSAPSNQIVVSDDRETEKPKAERVSYSRPGNAR
jgi:N-acetylmuramoyl-L-alanine amidase